MDYSLWQQSRQRASGWATQLLDLVCPPICQLCRRQDLEAQRNALCQSCLEKILAARYPACQRCGARQLPLGLACTTCQGRHFSFRQVLVMGPYEDLLREAVLATKRSGFGPLAYVLGELLAELLLARCPAGSYDLLLPAPIHWRRRFQRGFHATAVMATALERRTGIAASQRLLVHRRAPSKQGTLTEPARQANVRGAYRLRQPAAVCGKRIVLIDDVMTSGATAEELSRLLKAAGAEQVDLLIAARASAGGELKSQRTS